MHTEDDTFNALRRIPFEQMRRLAGRAKIARMMGDESIDLHKLFKENGWTQVAYDAKLAEITAPIIIHDFGPRGTYKTEHSVEIHLGQHS